MSSKQGTKFRTIHKFGKRRRKRKSTDKTTEVPSTSVDLEDQSSPTHATDDVTQETSTSASRDAETDVIGASGRKLDYFKSKKRKNEDDDEDNIEADDTQQPARPEDSDALNVIVNMGCLQQIITSSRVLCPECEEQVRVYFRLNFVFLGLFL